MTIDVAPPALERRLEVSRAGFILDQDEDTDMHGTTYQPAHPVDSGAGASGNTKMKKEILGRGLLDNEPTPSHRSQKRSRIDTNGTSGSEEEAEKQIPVVQPPKKKAAAIPQAKKASVPAKPRPDSWPHGLTDPTVSV